MTKVFYIIFLIACPVFLQAQLPDGFVRQEIVVGLNPAKLALAPDGRIFLTEKDGRVRILRDDVLLPDPFLEIEVDHSNERGLTGIAFDPDFNTNNYIYFYYAPPGKNFNRISRFTANGDLAIPGSEKILFELDKMHGDIHNGGTMHFGFDGKLYVASGDSGIPWWAENKDFLLGKVLRLNPDGTIPEDNPFYNMYNGNDGKSKAIYASGLRNPFSSAMHPITGDIYINDVGQGTWEEINKLEAGRFYGWGRVEGFRNGQDVPANYKDPEYVYRHVSKSCAIVGSTIYEPEVYSFPEKYWGKYFFNDYCTGEMRVLDLETNKLQEVFMTDGNRMIEILTDPKGHLYYLERRGKADGSAEDNTGTNEGALMKIIYTGSGAPFVSIQPRDQFTVENESAFFEVVALGEETLTYQWYKNGTIIDQANGPSYEISNTSLSDDDAAFYVVIKNGEGEISSETARLDVTDNQRPIPTITIPKENEKYIAGQTISFAGFAEDPELGNISSEKMWWKVDFHHDEHVHPGLPLTNGIMSGDFAVPTIGEISTNVFYRITLIAEDDFGLRKSTFVDIFPEIVINQFSTDPPNLKLSKDGLLEMAPFTTESVKGVSRTIEAPLKQESINDIFIFKNWNNGQTSRFFTVDDGEQSENTAIYESFLKGKGNGLTASFYDNQELEGEPILVIQDSVINYQFFGDAPREGLPEDDFSIRWEGYILPYVSGQYTFQTQSDDGVRLWVNGEKIIDEWTGGGHSEQGTIELEGNKLYAINLEYQEILYAAHIRLRWASDRFISEVIPQSQMYGKEFLQPPTDRPEFLISPNPASEMTFIKTFSDIRERLRVSIVDMSGRVVNEQQVEVVFGDQNINLPLQGMSAGAYLVKVFRGEGEPVFEQMLIIQ